MKTHKVIILGCIVLISAGCQNNIITAERSAPSTSFVILDQDSKKTISAYEYSDDGKTLVSSRSYDDDETLEKTVHYEYDGSGLLSRTIEVDPETRAMVEKSYSYAKTYNDDGSLSKIITTGSDRQTSTRSFTYDDSGNIILVTDETDDELTRTIEGKTYE